MVGGVGGSGFDKWARFTQFGVRFMVKAAFHGHGYRTGFSATSPTPNLPTPNPPTNEQNVPFRLLSFISPSKYYNANQKFSRPTKDN